MPKWHSGGQPQRAGHAEPGGHAAQPHLHVELDVLAGVDHVEAGHPEHHRRRRARPAARRLPPRIATQAASGASINAAPSQKWASTVNRLAKL